MDGISFECLSALQEIGNIGAGHATTALAQMLQTKVDMSVPRAEFLEFKDVGAAIGGEETLMAGIYLGVEGDINGSMMFLTEKKTAKLLASKLMCGMGGSEGDEFNEMELSAINEIGNIMTGAYLNALSDMTQLKIYPSTPQLAIDMAGAILSVPAIEFGALGDRMLMIQTKFTDLVDIDGFFILVPDLESYKKIMTVLGLGQLV